MLLLLSSCEPRGRQKYPNFKSITLLRSQLLPQHPSEKMAVVFHDVLTVDNSANSFSCLGTFFLPQNTCQGRMHPRINDEK